MTRPHHGENALGLRDPVGRSAALRSSRMAFAETAAANGLAM